MRQKAATHLSLYLLHGLPVPRFSDAQKHFLMRAALSLSCNHCGYDALWRQYAEGLHQLPKADLRAEADAAVARAYGLSRAQYDHLLNSFSHRSCPDAHGRCLDAFDRWRHGEGQRLF